VDQEWTRQPPQLLLGDRREIFGSRDHIRTTELLARLAEMEIASGHPDLWTLAGMLKAFGIAAKIKNVHGRPEQVYLRDAHFEEQRCAIRRPPAPSTRPKTRTVEPARFDLDEALGEAEDRMAAIGAAREIRLLVSLRPRRGAPP
jgi:hypothetical protein